MGVLRMISKLASPALYASGAYARGWQRRARLSPVTLVLVYHRVTQQTDRRPDQFGIERGMHAEVFEAQMRFMLKHFAPVAVSRLLEPPAQRLRFAVTLDDGYEDNFRVAAPILRRLGVPATFYVVSDYVDTDRVFWWEQLAEAVRATREPSFDGLPLGTPAQRRLVYQRLSVALRTAPHAALAARLERVLGALGARPRAEGRAYPLMSWRQLQELVRQGFEIGGHTASHCNIVGADRELLRTEIVSSARCIEDRVGAPVLSFAYPFGDHGRGDAAVSALLREAGCRIAFPGASGVVAGEADPFGLPRVPFKWPFHFACAFHVEQAFADSPAL
jgi:peptidoglycan/xylan/chitin deacetylase (PgdA/CDA1 family)